MENFIVKSDFDGLELHVSVVLPEGERKGILQILHGMGEFRQRYEEFAKFFALHGYIVVCHDHRGHGDSVKSEKDFGYFYEKSGRAIVGDCACVTREIQSRYPSLPVYLFGHSMGSMIARCYLQEHDALLTKAVICGSPCKNPLVDMAIALTKCIILFKGDRHRSKFLSYVTTGKGNERFKGEGRGAWLSHDRENIEWFYSHPKGRKGFTCNGFLNLFRLMKNTYTKSLYRVQNPTLPIRFISGSEDAVLGSEEKWLKTQGFLRKAGYKNVTGKLYEGMRHEIHNDTTKEEVLADLLAFLEE